MKVIPVPCLKDNYAYLVVNESSNEAAVVDPSEAPPVQAALQQHGLHLVAILNTHHHWDHIGGNKVLLAVQPNLAVYAHASDAGRVDGQTVKLNTGDTFQVAGLPVRVLHNPGHTTGAVSYVIEDAVFTGDTMFAAGCGRLFEGTPAMMYTSLCETIGGLPPETRVYFGHEYTESNLKFALHVEPDNADVRQRLADVSAARKAGRITTPSTLGEEWRTNPFMRHDSPAIQAAVKQADPGNDLAPASVLGAVRQMKDNF